MERMVEVSAVNGAEEVAWRTPIEAAVFLAGDRKRAIPPDDLYDRLKPFEDDLLADDRHASDDE
jgi:hypothetical protein